VKISSFFLIILISLFGGAVFFLIDQGYLLVLWTQGSTEIARASHNQLRFARQKTVKCFSWNNNRMYFDEAPLVWIEGDDVKNLTSLVKHWLSFIQGEGLIAKHVALESVAIVHQEQEALISFDRSIFSSAASTRQKWGICESLLATIRYSGVKIQKIRLLVEGAPLNDAHLDLSISWPIDGFSSI
jgi:hypothetical protein